MKQFEQEGSKGEKMLLQACLCLAAKHWKAHTT